MWLTDKIIPFWIPSRHVCNVEIGEVFQDDVGFYRLLFRDSFKAKIVESNWFTDMWYCKKKDR